MQLSCPGLLFLILTFSVALAVPFQHLTSNALPISRPIISRKEFILICWARHLRSMLHRQQRRCLKSKFIRPLETTMAKMFQDCGEIDRTTLFTLVLFNMRQGSVNSVRKHDAHFALEFTILYLIPDSFAKLTLHLLLVSNFTTVLPHWLIYLTESSHNQFRLSWR